MKNIINTITIMAVMATIIFVGFTAVHMVTSDPSQISQPYNGTSTLSVEPKANNCLQSCAVPVQRTAPSTLLQDAQ